MSWLHRGGLKPNFLLQRIKSEFAKAISLNGQGILLALKENVIHYHSKPEDPSTESIPHRFGLPTDNPHRHHQQEEAVPHLHTKDNKSKA
jgi:hypothetical protein